MILLLRVARAVCTPRRSTPSRTKYHQASGRGLSLRGRSPGLLRLLGSCWLVFAPPAASLPDGMDSDLKAETCLSTGGKCVRDVKARQAEASAAGRETHIFRVEHDGQVTESLFDPHVCWGLHDVSNIVSDYLRCL